MATPSQLTYCGVFVLAGRPNAGKSTLLNLLVGKTLAMTSARPQSTRLPVIGTRSEGAHQLMFVDPPGLLEPRYLLQQAMLQQALAHLARADAIVYLHPADAGEAAPLETLLPPEVRVRAPVLSVLTKADLIPADRPHANLLPISAVTGEGLDALLAWCRDHAPEGPFRHDPEELSTQPVRFFVTEFVREAAFEVLGEELPYAVAVQVDEFREADDPVYIRLTLYVERNSQKGMVIGSKGRTIKALGELARHKIESLLEARVYLDLWVKVLPKWRTRPHALRQLGFPAPAGRSR